MKPKIKEKLLPQNKIIKKENSEINKITKKEDTEFNKLLLKHQKELLKSKEKTNKIIIGMQKKIKETNGIWLPDLNIKYNNINTNSWFSINKTDKQDTLYKYDNYKTEKPNIIKLKTIKVNLFLNKDQKEIINNMLQLFIKMYNITLENIKQEDNKKISYYTLRKSLFNTKKELRKDSKITIHDLDNAIALAVQNYNTGLILYKKKLIKHFRIRYWKEDKNTQMMKIEKTQIKNNTIRIKTLGVIKGKYNNKDYNFDEIKNDCILQKVNNKYYLLIPTEVKKQTREKIRNKIISIDPGIRTFNTCITENSCIKIGENCSDKLKQYLLRKDDILGNKFISKSIKKKNELNINKKIRNLTDELHWKTINYLIKNNDTILIGDMSSKSIVSKESNLFEMTKRIALHLKFYVFRQRLKYKCDVNKVNYGKINEYYTSKMCSNCGLIKDDLGKSKIYECNLCKIVLDRDINGARNILIKAII
jgi:transposase